MLQACRVQLLCYILDLIVLVGLQQLLPPLLEVRLKLFLPNIFSKDTILLGGLLLIILMCPLQKH